MWTVYLGYSHPPPTTPTYSLLDICNYPNRSDLMRLMITTLDFAHDVHSRVILNKLLTATHKEMRLYSTQHMRVLLRAKMPFFNSWGLELLLPQVTFLSSTCKSKSVISHSQLKPLIWVICVSETSVWFFVHVTMYFIPPSHTHMHIVVRYRSTSCHGGSGHFRWGVWRGDISGSSSAGAATTSPSWREGGSSSHEVLLC